MKTYQNWKDIEVGGSEDLGVDVKYFAFATAIPTANVFQSMRTLFNGDARSILIGAYQNLKVTNRTIATSAKGAAKPSAKQIQDATLAVAREQIANGEDVDAALNAGAANGYERAVKTLAAAPRKRGISKTEHEALREHEKEELALVFAS